MTRHKRRRTDVVDRWKGDANAAVTAAIELGADMSPAAVRAKRRAADAFIDLHVAQQAEQARNARAHDWWRGQSRRTVRAQIARATWAPGRPEPTAA